MVVFLLNPVAGNGALQAVLPQIEAYAERHGMNCEFLYTQHTHHATQLSREYAGKAAAVVAVGGDGTVHEAAAGLIGTDTPLGVVACGTGNDLIKCLGVPKDTAAALDTIRTGRVRRIDTGTVDGKAFVNVAGFGFDVDVLINAERYKKKHSGLAAYMMGLVRALFGMYFTDIRMRINGETIEAKSLITSVGNGRIIGGGIPITPEALVDDGLFDVLIVDAIPRWKVPFVLPKLMKGTHIHVKYCKYLRADAVDIETELPVTCQLDGEIMPLDRLDFRLLPQSLGVLVPDR